jgi:serine/threonine protein kinase
MTLQTGTRLGPYEIVSRVGAGGMGEVFRALDTRLDRTVAVKTLPVELARNSQLRLRFQREAKAISALSHPHICALYDVGEHDGVDYLVMEYLEGETLAERLSRGPLPLKEALRVGIEMAGALERAHREGVVHRDLKPGNVMLTRNGAKLLDFGLAKAASVTTPISAEDPTVQHASTPLTAEGTIVGTFQYMAPEQLEGQQLDHRTDIFAFGALLYEMITGVRAFSGKTRTSLIASIVGSSPRPMAEIAPVTPPELEHVVQRCLEKEPEARWQSAHDIGLELEWIARRAETAEPASRSSRRWAWITGAVTVGAILIAAIASLMAIRSRSTDRDGLALRTHILPPKDKSFEPLMDTLSISPDGRYVTFAVAGDLRLWVRPFDSTEARPLDGTEHSRFPFWSPDSRWIAFFDYQKLKKVSLNGAPPVTICDAPRGRSGTWNKDGVILFSPTATTGIHRVSANGGVPQPVTALDKSRNETTHRWPVFLADGKRFLYFAGTHAETVGSELHAIYLSSLDNPKERTLLTPARSNALIVNDHLLYVRDQLLVAQPFNGRAGRLEGEPFRIAEGIEYDAEYFRGAFAASDGGILVHRTLASPPDASLRWFENGRLGEPLTPSLPLRDLTVSPDRKRVAASVVDRATGLADIWVLDLGSSQQTRLTSTPNDGEESPVWTRDGRQIIFSRHPGFKTGGDIFVVAADGSGAERNLYRTTKETLPRTVTADGRLLFDDVDDQGGGRQADIALLSLSGGAPQPFLNGPATETHASLSPDERWLSYISDEGGAPQVYAASFPSRGSRMQVSPRPALTAAWAGGGVTFLSIDGIYHVPLRVEQGRLIAGPEKKLDIRNPSVVSGEAVTGDLGLMAVRSPDPYEESIAVTTRWLPR